MTEHTTAPSGLDIVTVDSITAIGRDHWNRFAGTDNPLVGYDFLEALVCVAGVPEDDAEALAADRAYPWSPAGCP